MEFKHLAGHPIQNKSLTKQQSSRQDGLWTQTPWVQIPALLFFSVTLGQFPDLSSLGFPMCKIGMPGPFSIGFPAVIKSVLQNA